MKICRWESTQTVPGPGCKPAGEDYMKTRVSSISTLQERTLLMRNTAHLVFSSCWVQVWPDQFYSLANTRAQHTLFRVPSRGFSPILVNGHSERNEKKMRRRRVGGGERGMSRPSGPCICSTAAPAVNSHDRRTNTGTCGNEHTLTYTLSFLWVRYTSADPPWITSPRLLSVCVSSASVPIR